MSADEVVALRYHRIEEPIIPELVAAEGEAYPDPWTEGMFRQEIHNAASEFFVVYQGRNIVGYVGFWLVIDEAHITKVTVLPAYRRRGYGREVLEWLLRRAESMGANIARLEVRESNLPALALYEALGFTRDGVRKGYYETSRESAVVMSLCLRGT